MAHKKQPPPSLGQGGGENELGNIGKPCLPPSAPSSKSKRVVLARIPIGHDEIVVTLDDRDRLDLRVHTPTGGLHFPSNNGLTIKREHVAALIEGLERATRKEAAA